MEWSTWASFAFTFLVLGRLIFWTYKLERNALNKKSKDQTRVRLGLRNENGQWRNLSFNMPNNELKALISGNKNELTAKRA